MISEQNSSITSCIMEAIRVWLLMLSLWFASASKVSVNFYGEALCPFCARFSLLLEQLQDSSVLDLTDLNYVAWGNAQRQDAGAGVRCQHGPVECTMDRVQNCAIHLNPDQAVWLPFVACLEKNQGESMGNHVEPCAQASNVSYGAINDCAKGSLGDELEAAAANKTAQLDPAHQYVPWVTVNSIPLRENYGNVRQFICAAAGPNVSRPDACFEELTGPLLAKHLQPSQFQEAGHLTLAG